MDFEIVKRQIIKAYNQIHNNGKCGSWNAGNYIAVFSYYYSHYKSLFKCDHPRMTTKTIADIMKEMPFLDGASIDADIYPVMIDRYFEIPFDNCNYSIAHFMSGDIRMNRYYELLY